MTYSAGGHTENEFCNRRRAQFYLTQALIHLRVCSRISSDNSRASAARARITPPNHRCPASDRCCALLGGGWRRDRLFDARDLRTKPFRLRGFCCRRLVANGSGEAASSTRVAPGPSTFIAGG